MRTVTFSHPEVANILNREFVNTFTNLEGDPTAGQSIQHAPNDSAGFCIRGNGKQNVQTIFMTPAGEIFHAACGFLSPEDYHQEATFALRLFDELQRTKPEERSVVVAQTHRDRLTELGLENQDGLGLNAMMNAMRDGSGFMGPSRSQQKGSGNRNSFGNEMGNEMMGNVFGNLVRRQFVSDNQFSIDYPLITSNQLERDPTKLVGREKSFFSSSSNSSHR